MKKQKIFIVLHIATLLALLAIGVLLYTISFKLDTVDRATVEDSNRQQKEINNLRKCIEKSDTNCTYGKYVK